MSQNNWENFLKNLGEWQGSFTKISPDGEILDSTLSIINLEGLENNKLVKFRLRRFGGNSYEETPTQDYAQEYRSVGKQMIFFLTLGQSLVLLKAIAAYVVYYSMIVKMRFLMLR